jgi:hypothetical protein
MTDKKITRQEMVSAIESSGYLIEQRVEPILKKAGFLVHTNDVFKDDETGKTREIDLTAISGKVLFGNHMLFPFLIIECENNKQPVVFFRNEATVSSLHHEDIKISGSPTFLVKNENDLIPLSEALKLNKYHHYCQGTFSTQYCSFQFVEKGQTKKWIAVHPELQHDTFQNIVKCLNFNIDNHFANYELPEVGEDDVANIQLYYPILILQGDLFEAFLEKGTLKIESRKHIQYRKQIVRHTEPITTQIDVITEDYLLEFIKIIESEVDRICGQLKRKKDDITFSLKIIVDELRETKDPSEYRKILEY